MESAVSVSTTLPGIRNAKPLTEADAPMVQELVQILKKYDALDRFGLTLLHEHLPLAEDEIMMETTDRAARTQIIRPVPKSTLQAPGYFASAWRLDTGEPTQGCYDFPD